MKKITIVLILIISSFGVSVMNAADYKWLTFTLADDTEISVASDNLRLSYSDGSLQLTSLSVNKTLPVASLKSMRFTSSSSGIQEIESSGNLEVYTLQGVKLGEYTKLDEVRNVLPAGIYVVKSEKQIVKIIL